MPYAIDLERDADRGLDRYTITVDERFDPRDARELGDWMTAAAQNPTAAFTIDATQAPAERGVLAPLFARIARMRERVEVVRRGVAARAPLAVGVFDGLFALG